MEIMIDATEDLYGSEADPHEARRIAVKVAELLRRRGHTVRIAAPGEHVYNGPNAQNLIDMAYALVL